MTFAGADTIKAGIIGLDIFLETALAWPFLPLEWPLTSVVAIVALSYAMRLDVRYHTLLSNEVGRRRERDHE